MQTGIIREMIVGKTLDAGLAAESALAAGYGLYGSSAKTGQKCGIRMITFLQKVIMVQLMSNAVASSGINGNGWERSIRVTKQTGPEVFHPKEMVDLFPLANGARPTKANGYDSAHFFSEQRSAFYRTFAFFWLEVAHQRKLQLKWYGYIDGLTRAIKQLIVMEI